jgi:hypothetical protein
LQYTPPPFKKSPAYDRHTKVGHHTGSLLGANTSHGTIL